MKPIYDKSTGLLMIYDELMSGRYVKKSEMARKLGLSQKTVYRYIDNLRGYFENCEIPMQIKSERVKGYHLEGMNSSENLCGKDILAIAKVLLESRGFNKKEMENLIQKLLNCCPKDSAIHVEDKIGNELCYYVQPMHSDTLIDKIWDISQAIRDQARIEINYSKVGKDGKVSENGKTRIVEPQGILFAEYYFYLAACIKDRDYEYPTIFRLDRIREYKIIDENFNVVYRDRFQAGEFRKLIQFMHAGKIQNMKFKYTGSSIEAVMDRLPTARIVDEKEGEYIIRAKVFGNGIRMWLLSQGDSIEVLEPAELKEDMKRVVENMAGIYGV